MTRLTLRLLAAPALATLLLAGCGDSEAPASTADPAVSTTDAAPAALPDGVEQHDGSLAAGDQTLESGEYADVYKVDVRAGQWILAEMRSSALDPYLILRSPAGNQTENDDANDTDTTMTVVRQQATEAGQWDVLATSYEPGEAGAYTLRISVSDAEPAMPGAPAPAAASN